MAISIVSAVIAGLLWLAILSSPLFFLVPRLRRWWMAPIGRHFRDRKARKVTMAQARRDARTAVLESELREFGPF